MTTPALPATSTVATVSNASSLLTEIESEYTAAKNKIVAVLNSHIASHQAQVAAHTAEVTAAQAVIAKANPTATTQADQAAAIILTSSSGVQAAVVWLAAKWRYIAVAVSASLVIYGFHAGIIHV